MCFSPDRSRVCIFVISIYCLQCDTKFKLLRCIPVIIIGNQEFKVEVVVNGSLANITADTGARVSVGVVK